ncbi:MAG: DHH family phosphoesterase, partial [Chloroflexota bacterium]|nr:DHH family phosphoesterase [Chloroflexota bacterium]
MQARRRWRVRPQAPAEELADAPFPPLIRHLLYHRGVRSQDEAARFLFLPPEADWPQPDPRLLPGVDQAVERLAAAIEGSEAIAVFGDFDVDGVTAAALLTQALREAGATVFPYIPNRFSEGYGLSVAAMSTLRGQGAWLLVAADCGTSSIPEIEHARRLGMDVIVVDHHAIPPSTGAASGAPAGGAASGHTGGAASGAPTALVNPRAAGPENPHWELASVGVAYHLMAALYEARGRPWEPRRFLDLVAIGTVADVAPLVRENRYLVREGLAALRQAQGQRQAPRPGSGQAERPGPSAPLRPGLRALMEVAGLRPEVVDSEAIGYTLGPRLNAAGRLAHAGLSLRLLLTEDEGEAQAIAKQLNQLNQERQRQTNEALALASELVAAEDPDGSGPLIFVGHRDISEGIVGLVAGKLAEERYRPAIVYRAGEQESRASCRSIPEFDMVGALRRQGHLLVRYGGHHQAAGFTVANGNLAALRSGLLEEAAGELAGLELTPTLDIDAELPLGRLRGEEIRWLQRLQPFGQGNAEPLFL